jgi:hypothetical protein
MFFTVILSYCLPFPSIFVGYQIIWVLWILFPCLAFTFFFSPHDPQVMTLMPVKNADHLKDFWRFLIYFGVRGLLPAILCVILFVL